ncbi:glycolate oxidase FAD binding subunit [Sulfuritortus calidifontis]|uniref:Glycolate oxidase FAD binding subunit n=1 Tax=Sulfuritortus calidifontis TaxID=1914471 RepID=A0A4R3JV23_9PROT|nr:glycolate oxidase subunit GlcE [Sulfuritortus calidifontis]TCS71699.1 glycolate oxidase FAD binding subunit [Sulfuritortus calidifontis]
MSADLSRELQERVAEAAAAGEKLAIVGGGSKASLGRPVQGTPLNVAGHSGVVSYEPRELVLTARAGTPLREIENLLAAQGQMLPFEPPHFGATATLGGSIACGLSGPRRPWAGSARDHVLGVRLLNGRAEVLRFGGEVMKNVAGYDLSRLQAGAFGTLGVLLEVSLKVVPRPAKEITLVQERGAADSLAYLTELARRPLPLSAACHDGARLYLRLSGAASAVAQSRGLLGGEIFAEDENFWRDKIKEQRHGFFAGEMPLWRLSLPPAAPWLELPGKVLLDWAGAQRWLRSEAPAATIRQLAVAAGGHATLFRGGDRAGEVFQPLPPAMAALQRRIKHAFDPQGLFNPGRMYPDL